MTLKFVCADPMLLCYEGDEGDEGGFDLSGDEGKDAAGLDLSGDENNDAGGGKSVADVKIISNPTDAATFTQEQVNKFLAEDRRKRDSKVKSQADQFQKMDDRLQQMILAAETTKEQKSMLEADLEDLRASQRTEQEQRDHLALQSKERHENEVKTIQDAAVKWEGLYKTSMIQRALIDAATEHDAYNPQQIIDKLERHTEMKQDKDPEGRLLETYSPKTAVKVKDDDGNVLTAWKTPQEAVELLKTNLDADGNLFRSSVMVGIGVGTATAPGANPNTLADGNKLSDEEWFAAAKDGKFDLPTRHH